MDIINAICDERLALTDILTERRWHLVNVLRNVEVVNLEDLDNILQQCCRLRRNVIAAMKSLDVLEKDYRRCQSEQRSTNFTKNSSFQSHNSIRSSEVLTTALVS